MTLSEFMNHVSVTASDNNNGSWSVHLILKDLTKTTLTINDCNSEYEAKERAYMYLDEIVKKSNNPK